jgi:hypothetical protein
MPTYVNLVRWTDSDGPTKASRTTRLARLRSRFRQAHRKLPLMITTEQHGAIPGTQCHAEQGALKTRWLPEAKPTTPKLRSPKPV